MNFTIALHTTAPIAHPIRRMTIATIRFGMNMITPVHNSWKELCNTCPHVFKTI